MSILVFSVFMIAPSLVLVVQPSANSLNLSSNASMSYSATIALQSSTYARMKPSVSLVSSPLSPSSSLCDARFFSRSWSCSSVSISLSTMATKIGEKGHI